MVKKMMNDAECGTILNKAPAPALEPESFKLNPKNDSGPLTGIKVLNEIDLNEKENIEEDFDIDSNEPNNVFDSVK